MIRTALSVVLSFFLSAGNENRSMDDLPLNMVQIIGSHNSYKQAIDPPLFNMIRYMDQSAARSLEYTHVSLSEQLSMGLRNLEIDLYADAHGGKYAHPKGLRWEGRRKKAYPYDPRGEMKEPGFKIMHIQDIDFRSNCLTLRACLQELKAWSDEHPNHVPVFITMNVKDNTIPGLTRPEKFTSAVFDRLDSALRAGLGDDKLLIPDNIRGDSSTLEKAVLNGGWPLLSEARGKFVFILDETGKKQQAYIARHPSLRGRVLFVNAPPGTPEAAFLIINDPIRDMAKIRECVRKGYIVRTRADEGTIEARRNDPRRFRAACTSGAQIISTDYYLASSLFPSEYVIRFDQGGYVRENPYLNGYLAAKQ